MRIAMLSPIVWRTPPRKYGPWEQVASVLTEGLVKKGIDVTLFATGDSVTSAHHEWICEVPYAENPRADPKVWECLHISHCMEMAEDFDLIHNHFDFLPLTYSKLISTPMLTTIHGFSSEKIIPVYQTYNSRVHYISISDSDRHPSLDYLDTIYHGIDSSRFSFRDQKQDYLLFFGRIHPHKGTLDAIRIAQKSGHRLKIAGLIQDKLYFRDEINPYIDGENIIYLGNVSQEEGNELLGKAKALLHPIHFDEPFGLSVAEALMCGTPVIAYQRGSMTELIDHGQTGFLVKNAEEAAAAVEKADGIHPAECRKQAMEKFSIQKMVDSYIRAYHRILS